MINFSENNYLIIICYKLLYLFKDIFYYNICAYCNKKIENKDKKYLSLCQCCINSISYISPIKHKKTIFLVYALGKYDGILRYIVTEKYRKKSIAYQSIKNNIIEMITFFNLDFDCILPVPKTSINKAKHQLNQTKIIAQIIASYYKKDIFENIYMKDIVLHNPILLQYKQKMKTILLKAIFIIML